MIKPKILNAANQFGLLKKGDKVAVALSGGADSMALLNALWSLKEQLKISICAVHFNHKIRGDESERDEQFVRERCERLSVPLFVGSADVPQYAKDNRLGLELAARQLRYEYFNGLDVDCIATAHTSSDNLETVLLNLTRGASLKGLCGIPPKRDRIIRPLIFCTREEIEAYCEQNKIEFVTDSTNLEDEYSRNNIRHNIVPVLKGINPSLETSVLRNTMFLREDSECLDALAQKEFDSRFQNSKLNINGFDLLPPSIAKRVIIKYYNAICSYDIDGYHINEIYRICLRGGDTGLVKNLSAKAKRGFLQIVDERALEDEIDFHLQIEKTENDLFCENKKVHNLLLKNSFDCDKIVGKLVKRTRIAGDKVRLKNKNCTKTLKKLYTEYSVPVELRENWPVIADDEGIVWIHGIGVAHRCAADETSKRIYKITVDKTFKGTYSNDK